jgi:REP element-mobilizing transposase RayT
VKEFKSFTARAVIEYLEGRTAVHLLAKLNNAKLHHKTRSEYQVWQEGSHPEQIHSEKMLLQKIDYIHNNPVRRGYVDEPKHWRYFSSRDYEGLKALVEVNTDWRDE